MGTVTGPLFKLGEFSHRDASSFKIVIDLKRLR